MDKKLLGVLVCVAGVILLAVSLLADTIGIGGSAGFGVNQILGAVAGALVAIGGVLLLIKK
jgi:hypothetical protein